MSFQPQQTERKLLNYNVSKADLFGTPLRSNRDLVQEINYFGMFFSFKALEHLNARKTETELQTGA